jgi:hypothetical protein
MYQRVDAPAATDHAEVVSPHGRKNAPHAVREQSSRTVLRAPSNPKRLATTTRRGIENQSPSRGGRRLYTSGSGLQQQIAVRLFRRVCKKRRR